MAQKRFERVEGAKKLGLNFHVRGDGTRAYYFSRGTPPPLLRSASSPHPVLSSSSEFTRDLWEGLFAVEENDYCHRVVTNRKQRVDLDRLFLQGRYRKLASPSRED